MRDDEGFERFVLSAYPALMHRAFLLVGDHGQAEDLVQSALTTAYTRWRRVREPHAYLRTVMTRSAIGWRRRRWGASTPPIRCRTDLTLETRWPTSTPPMRCAVR